MIMIFLLILTIVSLVLGPQQATSRLIAYIDLALILIFLIVGIGVYWYAGSRVDE